jgi:hypothetical protein
MLVFTTGMAFGQNFVDLDQSGGSTSDIEQIENNGSNTVQGLNKGSSGLGGNAFTQVNGSDLTVWQRVNGGGASHLLEGEQLDGGMHTMNVRQNGKSGQTATVDQRKGSGNVAYLKQRTAASGVSGNSANVIQQGSDVVRGPHGITTKVNFTNSGAGFAQQFGINNWLNIRQRAGSNKLYPQQLGDNNVIAMNQKFSSYAEILQDGNNNSVAKNASGNGIFQSRNAELYVQQTGSGNTVYGGQTAPTRDVACIQQNGTTNTTRLVQQ